MGTFLAVIAQTLQIGLRPGQDQGRLPARRITNHANLPGINIGRQASITECGGNGFGNVQGPPIQIAERTQAAAVLVVVTRMQDGDHDKALARQ
ncbi:hypothetical protein D3C76_1722940 [compost metagenome]